MQNEIEHLKEKFEQQEQLFSKFIKLIFDKYSHLETTIQNLNTSHHKQTKGIDERLRKIEKKVFQAQKKQSLKVEDLVNNENQDYNYQSGVQSSTREPIKTFTLANAGTQPSKGNISVSNRTSTTHRNNGYGEVKGKTKFLRKQTTSCQSDYRNQSFSEKNNLKSYTHNLQHSTFTKDPLSLAKNFLPTIVLQLEQKKKESLTSQMIKKELNHKNQVSRTYYNGGNNQINLSKCSSSKNFKYNEANIFNIQKFIPDKYSKNQKDLRSVSSHKNLKQTVLIDHTSPGIKNVEAISQVIKTQKPKEEDIIESALNDVPSTQLRDNYQKHIPSRTKRSFVQRPQTQNVRRATINTTHEVQMPQLSLMMKPIQRVKEDSHIRMSSQSSRSITSTSSVKSFANNRKSIMVGDEVPTSPKFIQHITNNDSHIIEDEFEDDNPKVLRKSLSMEKQNKMLKTEHILSHEELNDFDEGKTSSFVRIQKNPIGSEQRKEKLKAQQIVGSANCVYQSKDNNLSRFISGNKSQIDYKNHYNQVEFRNVTEIMAQKGSKCLCKASQVQRFNEDLERKASASFHSDVCGDFCKRLNPLQEREIIKKAFQNEIQEQLIRSGSPKDQNQSTLFYNRSRSPQGQNLQSSQNNTQQIKRYLVNAKWWRMWSDYVNFEASTSLDQSDEKKQTSGSTGEGLDERKELLRKLHFELNNEKSQSIYSKPGRICNDHLLVDGNNQRLKENLVEHFDFVVISGEVWKYLYSWYSADHIVVRFMKRDKTNKKAYYLELHPEKQRQRFDEKESEFFESESECNF